MAPQKSHKYGRLAAGWQRVALLCRRKPGPDRTTLARERQMALKSTLAPKDARRKIGPFVNAKKLLLAEKIFEKNLKKKDFKRRSSSNAQSVGH